MAIILGIETFISKLSAVDSGVAVVPSRSAPVIR